MKRKKCISDQKNKKKTEKSFFCDSHSPPFELDCKSVRHRFETNGRATREKKIDLYITDEKFVQLDRVATTAAAVALLQPNFYDAEVQC